MLKFTALFSAALMVNRIVVHKASSKTSIDPCKNKMTLECLIEASEKLCPNIYKQCDEDFKGDNKKIMVHLYKKFYTANDLPL